MMRGVLFMCALASAGCLRTTTYKCTTNDQCGASGACEATGYCSFADPKCAGQGDRSYGEFAGVYSNKCIDYVPPDLDGGTDGTLVDAPMADVPLGNCPTSYSIVHGTHRYRVIATGDIWATQLAACAADGANKYLAVPDDQTELSAILADANVANVWVGINDQTTEDTYATANAGTFAKSSPLWGSGEPDNTPQTGGGQADCTAGRMSDSRLVDDRCSETYQAVCECEP